MRCCELTQFIFLGMNGVAMARNGLCFIVVLLSVGVAMAQNGLILWENDATGSRKVSRYLPGLWDTILNSKMTAKVPKGKNAANYSIFVLLNPSVALSIVCYFP